MRLNVSFAQSLPHVLESGELLAIGAQTFTAGPFPAEATLTTIPTAATTDTSNTSRFMLSPLQLARRRRRAIWSHCSESSALRQVYFEQHPALAGAVVALHLGLDLEADSLVERDRGGVRRRGHAVDGR